MSWCMRVQPNESISLRFEVRSWRRRRARPDDPVTPVDMEFAYADAFGATVSPAYERCCSM